MVEWKLIQLLARNPNLIRAFDIDKSHPLIRKYNHFDEPGEYIDLEIII